jgi:NADH-quinone oxidoreductase subunit N
LAAGSSAVSGSLLVYLVAYAAAALGAFALVEYFAPASQDDIFLDQVHELYQRAPMACIALAILLLSLGGFPLTGGFIGKLVVFRDAWDAGLTGLVIFALLNSVVSFYYYLRFVMAMYMQPRVPGTEALAPAPMSRAVSATVLGMVVATLLIGILPDNLLAAARECTLDRAVVRGRPPVAAHVEGPSRLSLR